MKPAFTRRYRRRSTPARSEGAFFKKESQQEQNFFGESSHDPFFQPAIAPAQSIQRKCEHCEEDKKVQRAEDKKEEEKKVMKKEDKKEEEKVHRLPEKKEEEKVMKKEEKKEEEKVMKKEDKKEEEKVMKKEEKKEEEKLMKMEEKKEEDKVHKKEAGTSALPGKGVSSYISSLPGKGQPLPAHANHFFSSKMGYDFSDVKVHTDREATESAKAVDAKAYTIKNNVVFNEGQFNTESSEGKRLMAHELSHVLQQENNISKKSIQRKIGDGHDLINPRFAGDLVLEGCYDNERILTVGSRGEAVKKIQQALIDAGFPLTKYGVDGIFGDETKTAVRNFQQAQVPAILVDGIVGPQTMGRLDSHFAPAPAPVPPAAPTMTHKTKFAAPDGSAETRNKVGVGEKVDFTGSAVGDWTATDGTPKILNGTDKFEWTAPDRVKTATIKFKIGSLEVSENMEVIEPNNITGTNKTELAFPAGTQGAGMTLDFLYHPLTVSFGNVKAKEVSHAASNITGYYLANGMPHFHNTGDTFTQIKENNVDSATDTASQNGYPSPWSAGGFDWIVPNKFKVNTEAGDGKEFTHVPQIFRMIDNTGKTVITKAGLKVERTP